MINKDSFNIEKEYGNSTEIANMETINKYESDHGINQ